MVGSRGGRPGSDGVEEVVDKEPTAGAAAAKAANMALGSPLSLVPADRHDDELPPLYAVGELSSVAALVVVEVADESCRCVPRVLGALAVVVRLLVLCSMAASADWVLAVAV